MGAQALVCGRCNHSHDGECRQGGVHCFKSGQTNYSARECPLKVVDQARGDIDALTPGEVDDEALETQDVGVITNMNLLKSFKI